ncbi:D-hexose-6-phosphate mutarotase [Lamprobacter modestohalophilus]|uniref:D-hexose-6-phosphate mutarotase n=1 Tax=Lamprobacter modestohalophilus TaxID=1064514 RepID=UPI002ADEB521|nr:D-hexose-6-phosphate mutarotase [Lamprobacter modestohalophilus]MEA1049242.1 D-hexose-6-phosphate mutarotase [Lamprobacter modestohalophilus]
MDIAQANDALGLAGVLAICEGNGGLPLIHIDNAHASASISVHGGQVLSYCPVTAKDDLLFVSRQAYFQPDKAIKGGIPICWPWFGPDPEQRGRPDHGFVRDRSWQLLATEARVDGATRVLLGMRDDERSQALWPEPFSLELEITVGETLELVLMTQNTGAAPISVTQALHTYFSLGDVRKAQVLGLAGHDYIDKVTDGSRATQSGPINIDGPVNRIYLDTTDTLVIDDPSLGRSIHIEREGSRSAVVWNPWIEQSRAMGDFADDEYLRMICVETTNAAEDAVTIGAGERYRLYTSYRIHQE